MNENEPSEEDKKIRQSVEDGNAVKLKILLENETDVERPDRFGYTLLWVACIYRRIEVVRYLITRGALTDTLNPHHLTPLIFSVVNLDPPPLIKVLIEGGGNVYQKNKLGWSAELFMSKREEYKDILESVKSSRVLPLQVLCRNAVYTQRIPHDHIPQSLFDW